MAKTLEQLRETIKEHRTTRRNALWFLMNWSRNQGFATVLMHRCLRTFAGDSLLISEAARNYIISMTSCLETFYRDLFIYILKKDTTILKKVLPQVKDKQTLLEFFTVQQEGISFAELAAAAYNFQNIQEVDQSLQVLFEPGGYLNSLDTYEHKCRVRGVPAKLRLPNSWRSTFASLFQHRHSFVHDANTRCRLSGETMAQLESVVFHVVQFTATMVGSRFGNAGLMMFDELPYFVCVEDMMAEDWRIAGDGQLGVRLEGAVEGGSGESTAQDMPAPPT